MRIVLGSKSEDKYQILFNCLNVLKIQYSEIIKQDVRSDISDQPLSKEETILGATNRAKNAFKVVKDKKDIVSIGLEGGLTKIDGIYNLICAAVIYDGKNVYIGTSKLIILPIEVSEHIQNKHEFGVKIREYAQNCNPINYKDEKIDELISRKKSFNQAINKSLRLKNQKK